MVKRHTAHVSLTFLAGAAVALLAMIVLPFATSLFVAAVLAGALDPLTTSLTRILRGRRKTAALVLTFAVLLAVVAPLSALGAVLVPQIQSGVELLGRALADNAVGNLAERLPAILKPLAEHLQAALPSSLERLQEIMTAQGTRAAAVVGNLLSATGSFLLHSVLMLVALYFMLADGEELVLWLTEAIPLRRGQVRELLRDFRLVTVTVLVSTILTGAVQSLLAFLGYLFTGVPDPIFFAVTTFVLAMVPFLGATVVVVAVGVSMLAAGHVGAGVFLVAFAFGVVAMIDSVVKPLFISGGVPIHGAVIFFSLLGGLAAFGPVGFLVGPLAVSFLVAVVRMYRRDFGR